MVFRVENSNCLLRSIRVHVPHSGLTADEKVKRVSNLTLARKKITLIVFDMLKQGSKTLQVSCFQPGKQADLPQLLYKLFCHRDTL